MPSLRAPSLLLHTLDQHNVLTSLPLIRRAVHTGMGVGMRPFLSPSARTCIRWSSVTFGTWARACNSSSVVITCHRRTFHSSPYIFRTHPRARHLIAEGRTTTPINLDSESSEDQPAAPSSASSPFYLSTAFSLFAKRASRPFPPPFLSLPSGSFSDPLTNHSRPRARHPSVHGQLIKGVTNGDDAVLISGENFLCVNDGVGQWAQ
jgi:hypothetical protein